MDPVTIFLLAAVAGYVVAAPDPGTRTLSRGAAGAARAAGRAGWDQIRSEWAASASTRTATQAARRKRWSKTPGGRAALQGERAVRAVGRGARFGWRLTRVGVRIARVAAAAAPAGWRAGVEAARSRPGQRTKPDGIPDRSSDQATQYQTPDVAEEADPDRPADADASDPADEAPDLFCPECGEPVVRRPPTTWQSAWGPRPQYSHTDGEPLCPVVGKYGYVSAEPVTADEAPLDPPAPAGDNPKENDMSSTEAAEARPIDTTELVTVEDLRHEAGDASNVAHIIEAYLLVLSDWVKALPDRYAGAPFATAGITRGIAGVAEATPDVNLTQSMHEAFIGLQHEIDETTSLTEAAESLQADGQVDAFRTA